jgi:hypothetical protein
MNPSYGYRLYQAQRVRTRAEVLADDMRRGRQAAAVSRAGRGFARKARAAAMVPLNAIAAAARVSARAA